MRRTDRSVDGGAVDRNADSDRFDESSESDHRLATDGGRDRPDSEEDRGGSDDPRESDADRRRKRRAAVRPHESETDRVGETDDVGGEVDTDDQWAPPGVDPDDVPAYFPELSVEDPDPPPIVDRLGSVGIYLAVAALALAVIGIAAAARGIQPLGNAVITLSLGLGVFAMVFAMVFQAFTSDLLSGSE